MDREGGSGRLIGRLRFDLDGGGAPSWESASLLLGDEGASFEDVMELKKKIRKWKGEGDTFILERRKM